MSIEGCCTVNAPNWLIDRCIGVGILVTLDGYMNMALEQTEEFVNGELKAKYGECFIRGNNGEFLSACLSTHNTNINIHLF